MLDLEVKLANRLFPARKVFEFWKLGDCLLILWWIKFPGLDVKWSSVVEKTRIMSSSYHESDSMVSLLLLFFAMQLRKWNSRGTAVSDAAGRPEQQRHKRKHLAFDRFYSRSVLPTSVKAAAPSIDQRPSTPSPLECAIQRLRQWWQSLTVYK